MQRWKASNRLACPIKSRKLPNSIWLPAAPPTWPTVDTRSKRKFTQSNECAGGKWKLVDNFGQNYRLVDSFMRMDDPVISLAGENLNALKHLGRLIGGRPRHPTAEKSQSKEPKPTQFALIAKEMRHGATISADQFISS